MRGIYSDRECRFFIPSALLLIISEYHEEEVYVELPSFLLAVAASQFGCVFSGNYFETK